jgi:Transposase, Mutator family
LEKVRENGRVISMAVLIATGVERTGEREVLGVDVGPAEDLEFWRAFLRQLVSRGLRGVRLVTSDSHLGLKQAVAEVLVGASWQRCRVHFMRNALATVPKVAQQMVAATLRTIFAQPDLTTAHDAVERISWLLEKRYPKLTEDRDRHPGLLRIPRRAPSAGLVDQLPGAPQQGGLAALRRGRHLPQPAVPVTPDRRSARGAERRMGCRPTLLQHRVHEQAL